MKKSLVFTAGLLLVIFTYSCKPNRENKNETIADSLQQKTLTSIEFAEKFYDFGSVAEGEKVSHTFKFTNTGTTDLIVNSVKASCGCTASNYTKEAVKPGASGIIEVIFNSAGRPGPNHKSLTVVANTDPKTHVLTFSVQVEKEKDTENK